MLIVSDVGVHTCDGRRDRSQLSPWAARGVMILEPRGAQDYFVIFKNKMGSLAFRGAPAISPSDPTAWLITVLHPEAFASQPRLDLDVCAVSFRVADEEGSEELQGDLFPIFSRPLSAASSASNVTNAHGREHLSPLPRYSTSNGDSLPPLPVPKTPQPKVFPKITDPLKAFDILCSQLGKTFQKDELVAWSRQLGLKPKSSATKQDLCYEIALQVRKMK